MAGRDPPRRQEFRLVSLALGSVGFRLKSRVQVSEFRVRALGFRVWAFKLGAGVQGPGLDKGQGSNFQE